MGQMVVLFLKLETQCFDGNLEMTGQNFLEVDQFEIDPIPVVQGTDFVDAILKMNLILVDKTSVGRAGVGDDVNILELEAGTVQTESNGGKRNASGKLDSIEAFFFSGRNQLAVHEDCRCGIGMKEV